MDRRPHTTDTWTSYTLIGPGWLSGQLAVHRQLVLSFGHNRYPCQSDENFGIIQTYLICVNIIWRTKGLLQTVFYTAINIGILLNTDSLVTLSCAQAVVYQQYQDIHWIIIKDII